MVRWINFYRGLASNIQTTVYTLNTKIWPYVAVRTINMSNPTSTGATVKVWIVPGGWTGDITPFLVVPGWYIPPKNATTGDAAVSQWTGFEVMSDSGDSIIVEASQPDVISISINGGGSK
jgi:hypothetical protein